MPISLHNRICHERESKCYTRRGARLFAVLSEEVCNYADHSPWTRVADAGRRIPIFVPRSGFRCTAPPGMAKISQQCQRWSGRRNQRMCWRRETGLNAWQRRANGPCLPGNCLPETGARCFGRNRSWTLTTPTATKGCVPLQWDRWPTALRERTSIFFGCLPLSNWPQFATVADRSGRPVDVISGPVKSAGRC